MPAAHSADIRVRVIASVESGSSRREAAEEFDVSASSAFRAHRLIAQQCRRRRTDHRGVLQANVLAKALL
jgi:transposase